MEHSVVSSCFLQLSCMAKEVGEMTLVKNRKADKEMWGMVSASSRAALTTRCCHRKGKDLPVLRACRKAGKERVFRRGITQAQERREGMPLRKACWALLAQVTRVQVCRGWNSGMLPSERLGLSFQLQPGSFGLVCPSKGQRFKEIYSALRIVFIPLFMGRVLLGKKKQNQKVLGAWFHWMWMCNTTLSEETLFCNKCVKCQEKESTDKPRVNNLCFGNHELFKCCF